MSGSPARLRTLYVGNRGLLARFGAMSLARAVFTAGSIFLIREFLSGVLGDGEGPAADLAAEMGRSTALWAVAGILLAVYLGAAMCKLDSLVVQERLVRRVELTVMERLITHLLALSVPFLEREGQGDLLQAVREDITRLRIVLVARLSMLVDGAQAAALGVAAYVLSPWTLAVILILMAGAFPIYVLAERTRMRSIKARRTGYVLYDVVLELLNGIQVIKVFRGDEEQTRVALTKTRTYFDQLIELVRLQTLAMVFLDSFAGLSMVFVVIVGGFQVLAGDLGWPALMAFLVAIGAMNRPLNAMGKSYLALQRHAAATERIDEILAETPQVSDCPDAVACPADPGGLSFEGVTFERSDGVVLTGVTFDVKAGETVGIVGPSGAGKSTLLSLVARFHDPASGQVRIGGADLRALQLASYHERLALVTQEPFVFDTTVRDNIRCGRAGATDAEVVEAARAAGLHDEIAALPGGYDTLLGADGRGLSVGQAQRLCIARALLKDAPILLLDEATSSLDSVAESKIQAALDRLTAGRTTLVVAHRLSTLRGATRIVVMDRGAVVATGSHGELLESCPLYAEMWDRQRLHEPAETPPRV